MPKRKLRIVRRTNNIPVLGVCEFCNMQFPSHHRVSGPAEAQAIIQQQFNAHKCKPQDSDQNAAGIVKEATENE